MDNQKETDKFLEIYHLQRLNQEKKENLNKPITSKDVESVIKNPATNKNPRLNSFTGEFYQSFKEGLISIFLKLFQKKKMRKKHFQTYSIRPI